MEKVTLAIAVQIRKNRYLFFFAGFFYICAGCGLPRWLNQDNRCVRDVLDLSGILCRSSQSGCNYERKKKIIIENDEFMLFIPYIYLKPKVTLQFLSLNISIPVSI